MKINEYIRSKIKKREIPAQEWDLVQEQAKAVEEFTTEERFKFLMDFFNDNKSYILDLIAKNGVRKMTESVVNGDITRHYETTKEEQILEISGKYKLINDFLSYLETIKNRPAQYLEEQARGKITIGADKEEG